MSALLLLALLQIEGLRQPALSPDGSRIAFSYLGDLWIAPAEGGVAERVTATTDDEQKPCWSPDGASLAYSSDAGDNRDLYVIALADRAVRRLTHHTGVDDKPDWSPDGRFIAFHSDRDKLVNLPVDSEVLDLWCVAASGGSAWRLTRRRGENAAWAPDGKSIAFDFYSWGYADGEHDVAVLRVDGGRAAEGAVPEVVASGREDSRKPAWRGEALHFAHEANGIAHRPVMNLWSVPAGGGALVQTTGFADDRAEWPATSPGSGLIVFEHAFRLWAIDTAAPNPQPFALDIRIRDEDRPAIGEAKRRVIKSGALRPAWSTAGDAVLVEIEGHIWRLAPDGSTAEPLTRETAEDSDPAWAPDGFVFVRGEPGRPSRLMRRRGEVVEPLTETTGAFRAPSVSPDGTRVLCEREVDGAPQIVLVDRDGRVRVVAEQESVIVASPVFVSDDAFVYAATAYRGGQAESKVLRQTLDGERTELHAADGIIEDLAAGPGGELAWSIRPSSRDNPNIQILRGGSVTALPTGEKVSRFHPTWSPDGSMVLFVESKRTDFRQARFDPSADLVFRDAADEAGVLELPLRAELNQTAAEFNRYLFDVVWGSYFREYYDPFFHGAPWESVREKYLPRVVESRTTPERHDWMNRMIRELRSSHVALHARSPLGDVETRMLGIDYDVLADGTLRITAVVPGGPADAEKIRPGERIVAVGDVDLSPEHDVDRLLTFPRRPRIVRDVPVAVKNADGDIRTTYPDPVTSAQVRELRWLDEVARRERAVEEAGDGRLIYHAVRFMAAAETTKLRRALEAAADKEALVLDVRDGMGGMAHKEMLQILDDTAPERLDRRPACSIRYRNGRTHFDVYGGGGRGTRGESWNKPVILIINEISRSDKEILAHTFRHLGLGYVVGMQTAAGVIGGSDRPLPDGSSITVSVQGWFTHDGRNLEGSGVIPDFIVPYRFDDYAAGTDPQLARAIELLLAQLDGKIPALKKE